MGVTALIGLQWGDEGKGKIVDALSRETEIIVRAQGGATAGHTIRVGGRTRVLHLVPSGMLYPHVTGVIGNGVVVDPIQLMDEVDELSSSGCDVSGRLFVSDRAHLVLPHHRVQDLVQERRRAQGAIGTTGRGIGPAYQDKAARTGIRAIETLDRERLVRLVKKAAAEKAAGFSPEERELLEREMDMDRLVEACTRMAGMVRDTVAWLHEALDGDKDILLEGAQGTMLDIDLGTYPYVTSSNCQVGGLITGSGIAARHVRRVVAVAKAYCTRVGAGPFPTEIDGPEGEAIRSRGREFGATTGRPRRCGWFDAVAARYAVRLNGVDEIALTKTDVLEGRERIRICTAYRIDGRETEVFPAGDALERAEPIYADLPGFQGDLGDVRDAEHMPREVEGLIQTIEGTCGVRVSIVSTGPAREETVLR